MCVFTFVADPHQHAATHAKLIHRPENKTQLPIVVFVPSDQVSQNSITAAMIMPLICCTFFHSSPHFQWNQWFDYVFSCVDCHCSTWWWSSSSCSNDSFIVSLSSLHRSCRLLCVWIVHSLWYTSIILFTFLFRRWHFNTAIKTIHSPEINFE